MRNSDLGYSQENVVEVWLGDPGIMESLPAFKKQLLQSPYVTNISFSGNTPYYMYFKRPIILKNMEQERTIQSVSMQVGYDYLNVFGMEIVNGRNFSTERDDKTSVLVNEAFVKSLGDEDPLGQNVVLPYEGEKEIIGIIKDFHHASFHHEIMPLVYSLNNGQLILFARTRPGQSGEAVAYIKKTFDEFSLNEPFKYSFVVDDYLDLYRDEQRMGKMFVYFSGLAVFIACLGLFGLAMFSIERRIKEIGIRKVLGAGINDLVLFLSKEFMRLVLLANLLAWPVAFYFMNRWLQDFAFRAPLSLWTFLISGGIVFFIAFITVSFLTLKAALANPVDSLMYE